MSVSFCWPWDAVLLLPLIREHCRHDSRKTWQASCSIFFYWRIYGAGGLVLWMMFSTNTPFCYDHVLLGFWNLSLDVMVFIRVFFLCFCHDYMTLGIFRICVMSLSSIWFQITIKMSPGRRYHDFLVISLYSFLYLWMRSISQRSTCESFIAAFYLHTPCLNLLGFFGAFWVCKNLAVRT